MSLYGADSFTLIKFTTAHSKSTDKTLSPVFYYTVLAVIFLAWRQRGKHQAGLYIMLFKVSVDVY